MHVATVVSQFWHKVSHVTTRLFSLSGALVTESGAVLAVSLWWILRARGEFCFLDVLSLEFSVLSYSTVQPFISIFGLCVTQSLLCDIQPFFFFNGPVPLTLGLDAGQIDWKNARCLVPDTSLSITLTRRREEKFSPADPSSFLFTSFPIFRAPYPPPHPPNLRGVSYKAVCHPHGH